MTYPSLTIVTASLDLHTSYIGPQPLQLCHTVPSLFLALSRPTRCETASLMSAPYDNTISDQRDVLHSRDAAATARHGAFPVLSRLVLVAHIDGTGLGISEAFLLQWAVIMLEVGRRV